MISLEDTNGRRVSLPRIIVTTDPADYDAPVTLDERVQTIHVSDRYASAQLLERLTWAIEDAERVEDPQGAKRPVGAAH